MLIFLLFSLITSENDSTEEVTDSDEGFSTIPIPKRTPNPRTRTQSNEEDKQKFNYAKETLKNKYKQFD